MHSVDRQLDRCPLTSTEQLATDVHDDIGGPPRDTDETQARQTLGRQPRGIANCNGYIESSILRCHATQGTVSKKLPGADEADRIDLGQRYSLREQDVHQGTTNILTKLLNHKILLSHSDSSCVFEHL